jgi:hypothetical protein
LTKECVNPRPNRLVVEPRIGSSSNEVSIRWGRLLQSCHVAVRIEHQKVCPMAILFAATYSNRTASLVLDGCYGRLARAPDYPWGIPSEVLERALAQVRDAQFTVDAGDVSGPRYLAPHAMLEPEFVAQWWRYSRYTTSPSAAAPAHPGTHIGAVPPR